MIRHWRQEDVARARCRGQGCSRCEQGRKDDVWLLFKSFTFSFIIIPPRLLFLLRVCVCAWAWVRILCKQRLTHLFTTERRCSNVCVLIYRAECVCVCVLVLAQEINWHSKLSSTSHCLCLSVCLCVLPADSLSIRVSVCCSGNPR